MAAYRRGPVFLTRWMQCRGVKFNTKRKRPIHFQRRLLEAVAAPIIPELHERDPADFCSVLKDEKLRQATGTLEENLYEQFLIRCCKEAFEQNNMVIVFQKISMKTAELNVIKNKLWPLQIYIKYFHYNVVTQALPGTKWENLSCLLHPQNMYVFCAEPKISELVNTTRRMPEVMLLGGVVNNKMYTREGLLRMAALPPLDVLYGQTVGILNAGVGKTRSLLGSHQQRLAANLEQYIKDQGGSGIDAAAQSETPS